MYKLFISLKPNLPNVQEASERVFKRLKVETTIAVTVVEFVKLTLNSLIGEIPDLLRQEDFYVGTHFLFKYKTEKLKNIIRSYMDILAIVGVKISENIFTDLRKTF